MNISLQTQLATSLNYFSKYNSFFFYIKNDLIILLNLMYIKIEIIHLRNS